MILYKIYIAFKGFLMNLVEIKKLMEIFSSSDIAKLSLKQDNFELKLDKSATPSAPFVVSAPASAPQAQPAAPSQAPAAPSAPQPSATPSAPASGSESGEYITSPMVGTFYHKPSPDAAPYVSVGDKVKKGQTIGIIEAMKIMNEIEAECDCTIVSIETADGQPVEFGSNLIKIERL